MKWAWLGTRRGMRVDITVVHVSHDLDVEDIEQVLQGWIVGESSFYASRDESAFKLPELSPRQAQKIIREELADQGARLFETCWGDDLSKHEVSVIEEWSRRTVVRLYPKQALQRWGIGS